MAVPGETAAELFKRRAKGNAGSLSRILDKVSDQPPEVDDEVSEGWIPDRVHER